MAVKIVAGMKIEDITCDDWDKLQRDGGLLKVLRRCFVRSSFQSLSQGRPKDAARVLNPGEGALTQTLKTQWDGWRKKTTSNIVSDEGVKHYCNTVPINRQCMYKVLKYIVEKVEVEVSCEIQPGEETCP